MNKKLLNRVALSLLLAPVSLSAVCPCKFKNNAPQVPVAVGIQNVQQTQAPTKAVVAEVKTVEVQDPFAAFENDEDESCPIFFGNEEELKITINELPVLTQEEVKAENKPANTEKSSSIKKATLVAGSTTAVALASVAAINHLTKVENINF